MLWAPSDELAAVETWDNGKPYDKATKIEVPMVACLMSYYVGISIYIVNLMLYKFWVLTTFYIFLWDCYIRTFGVGG